MSYSVLIYEPDASEAQRGEAQQRFRAALEDALGDGELVAPVYRAYLRIRARHGDMPDPASLSEGERAIFEQWRAAETAAVAAAFGPNRYMGDADYEIKV